MEVGSDLRLLKKGTLEGAESEEAEGAELVDIPEPGVDSAVFREHHAAGEGQAKAVVRSEPPSENHPEEVSNDGNQAED